MLMHDLRTISKYRDTIILLYRPTLSPAPQFLPTNHISFLRPEMKFGATVINVDHNI